MASISPNTLITTKILIGGTVRRFKIPIKDLGANTLPGKLKELLAIPADYEAIFERYSDSASQYVVLDSNKPAVYKQLYRAAKAKLKLKIKVTVLNPAYSVQEVTESPDVPQITPPAYASQVTLPLYVPVQPETSEPVPAAAASASASSPEPTQEQLEKVVTSVVADYFESEECKSKLRAIVDEGIEKGFEKRSTSLPSSPSEAAKPATEAVPFNHPPLFSRQIYAVYCNCCESNVEDIHYHCGVCDNGDFDLCQNCKDSGKHCENNDHWLIKRTIKNGEIVASTTQSIRVPKKESKPDQVTEPQPQLQPAHEEDDLAHFCNGCCETFPEPEFVRCTTCPDFDLCIACHTRAEHGHHPGHVFKPATSQTRLSSAATSLLPAGRNFRHLAICDGCDKQIYGVRHKCLKCPDWDYCSNCIASIDISHPGHRFVPVYEALPIPLGAAVSAKHAGIYCDGPLCKTRLCIVGERYKCAICPDFDLCDACEASPLNKHNPTHPLIKFKTPVRNVTVQTSDIDAGEIALGDRVQLPPRAPTSTASTQVQTVVDIEPAAAVRERTPEKTEPEISEAKPMEVKPLVEEELKAIFIKDTIRDGTLMEAGAKFTQTWTLFNSGNRPWPTGVTLTFTGGDSFSESAPEKKSNTTVTSQETSAGHYVEFSVDLAAPAASRQHIGYWRLVTAEGVRFGPSLWCDIQVVQPKPVTPPMPIDTSPLKIAQVQSNPEANRVAPTTELEQKNTPAAESKENDTKPEEEDLLVQPEASQMIFPTLEKESPIPSTSSSTATVKNVEEEPQRLPSPSTAIGLPPSSPSTISGTFDDAGSDTLSFIDDDIEEEHFLSDDEDYDVVDASDEEEFRVLRRPQ